MEPNVAGFLNKFKGIMPHETKVRNAVVQVVQEVVGVSLDRSKIGVSGDSIFITGPAALRSELAMRQSKILARIKELDPDLTISKIQ